MIELIAVEAVPAVCDTPTKIYANLEARYREVPWKEDNTPENHRWVFTMSPDGNWSVILELGGKACIVASGKKLSAPTPNGNPA